MLICTPSFLIKTFICGGEADLGDKFFGNFFVDVLLHLSLMISIQRDFSLAKEDEIRFIGWTKDFSLSFMKEVNLDLHSSPISCFSDSINRNLIFDLLLL